MSKEEITSIVKEWMQTDSEMKTLQKELKVRRNNMKRVSERLITIMKERDIDAFNVKDGKLMYTQRNVKVAINKKNIVEILADYFEGDVSRAVEVGHYVMNNRKEVIKEKIELK